MKRTARHKWAIFCSYEGKLYVMVFNTRQEAVEHKQLLGYRYDYMHIKPVTIVEGWHK